MAVATAACDLCGATDRHPRFRLTTTSVVTCARCGLAYVAPRPAADVVESRVQQWASADVVDGERLRIAFNDGSLRRWRRYLGWVEGAVRSRTRRLLDVGCSTGALLSVARDRGWRVEGVEVGHASAVYAQQTVGLTVHEASLYDFVSTPGGYDAIVMLEVLEHMHSPRAALQRLYSWLAPGGVLLLSTPNFDSLFRRLHGPRWWVVNCEDEHLHFFSAATLTRALRECGLEVLRLRIRGFDIRGMLRARRQAAGAAVASAAADYYDERAARERLKARLRRLGVFTIARGLHGAFEFATSTRWSPVYGLGEQLVVVARRPHTS